MINLRAILFTLSILSILSCKKEGGVFISTEVEISVVNTQGQDLLNSVYTKDKISVTHFINGRQLPGQDFTIHQENLHVLTIYGSKPAENNMTLIQFGSASPDTMRREFIKYRGGIYCSKVWFKGILKFDDSKQTNQPERRFTIVK